MYSQTNSQVLSSDGERLIRMVTINGTPFWQASGRTFPVVAGAEDPPGDGKDGKDGKDGDGKPATSTDSKTGSGEGGTGDDDFDKDRALATIRKLRENERTSKKELDDLRKRVKEIDDKEKSESERLQERISTLEREAADLQRERQETQNVRAIERAAVKLGAADSEDVYRLLDSTEFEHDADGNLTNADALVKGLLEKKPYLKAIGANGKGNTSGVPSTPRSNGQPLTHDEQVKKNREELRASGRYIPL